MGDSEEYSCTVLHFVPRPILEEAENHTMRRVTWTLGKLPSLVVHRPP
jgi:hypothetical protein